MILENGSAGGISAPRAEGVDAKDIVDIVNKHGEERAALISILGEIQAKYRYLPEDALRIVADKTGCPLVDVYGAATFYRSFSLKPKGKHLICACLGTACHVRGAPRVAEEFQHQLGIRPGETTPDKEFTLETVNCLGACALGPIVVVDGRYFSNVTSAKVTRIIEDTLAGLNQADAKDDQRIFPIEVSCPHCGHSLMDESHPCDGYPTIQATAEFDHKHGWIRISSLYGRCTAQSEHDIPTNTIVDILCPHCRSKLLGPMKCLECGTPMAQMAARGGGRLLICSRCGCTGHMLDLGSADPGGGAGLAKLIGRK